MEKELDILQKIKKVETPPFLFTRIEAKLAEIASDYVSTPKAFLYFLGLALIITVNVWIISSGKTTEKSNLAEQLNIENSYQVYE